MSDDMDGTVMLYGLIIFAVVVIVAATLSMHK